MNYRIDIDFPDRSVILVDIDHVISDAAYRDGLLGGEWDAYHAASVDDREARDIGDLVRALQSSRYYTVGLTARPEKWRGITNAWLLDKNILFEFLLMRPDDNYMKSEELKVHLCKLAFGENFADKIKFIIDDHDAVCTAFRGVNVTVLQAYNRRYE